MKEIIFQVRISSTAIRWAAIGAIICCVCLPIRSEDVKLTSYYPSPSGLYKKMITTNDTYLARDGGRVGIGDVKTVPPQTALDIRGPVRIGIDATACSSQTEGAQRYNPTTKQMEFCNGTEWTAFLAGGTTNDTMEGAAIPWTISGTVYSVTWTKAVSPGGYLVLVYGTGVCSGVVPVFNATLNGTKQTQGLGGITTTSSYAFPGFSFQTTVPSSGTNAKTLNLLIASQCVPTALRIATLRVN